jgi:cytochrome c oxidase subunit II
MNNPIVQQVDNEFIFIVAISVFFLLLITVAMIYFVIRYRKSKNPVSSNITGNTTLEVLWTVIPLVLVLLIFYYGWAGFKTMRDVPPDAMTIKVTARMWRWSFEYPNKKQTDSVLYVPLNKPIKAEIHSLDVNHSFYIPAYRIKEDAIPGRTNYMWFLPNKLGDYDILCAEYCGLNHSYMRGKVVVMSEHDFYAWLNAPNPQDTLKTKTDSLKTVLSVDSLKTVTKETKKDSIQTIKKDTIK